MMLLVDFCSSFIFLGLGVGFACAVMWELEGLSITHANPGNCTYNVTCHDILFSMYVAKA
jgi:hypothetical protein